MQIIRIDQDQLDLVVDLFDKYRVFYKQPSNLTLAREFTRTRLVNNESVIFVARVNQTSMPIGFTQLYPKYSSARLEKNWILNDLFVDKPFRKQGIGQQLVETAMRFAENQHATFMDISTAVDNFSAQALYEKIGFDRQLHDLTFYDYRIRLDRDESSTR